MNEEQTIRAALDRHWAASDANDFEAEHEIYRDDAVLEYPQSAERIRGSTQYSSVSFCAAEQEALYGATHTRCCRPLGH
jgi:ketosteroid isomerase-like protein